MKTEIPNAEYIQAILDGKEVQKVIRNHWKPEQEWVTVDLAYIVSTPVGTFRIKPEPAPKREPLTVQVYRNVDGGIGLHENKTNSGFWSYIGEFVLTPKEQT